MTQSKSAPFHENLPAGLVKGYHAFWNGRLKHEQDKFRDLAENGQHPPALVIGCCDSRVAPEAIFDAGPGEIFVVRNIANLVPPYEKDGDLQETSAAIEYAVQALKVAHICVMGHAQCGGIRAYALGQTKKFEPLSEANFVARWKALVKPAARKLGKPDGDLDDYCEALCQASIQQGLKNLRTYPWLKKREKAGDLSLHGAYFDISNGKLMVLDQKNDAFVPAIAATS